MSALRRYRESPLKIRPLPDLDLARIAPLPSDQKRAALRQMKLGHPPYSYQPMRRSMLDILNVEAGPLGVVSRAPWQQVADQISKVSRSAEEAEANVAVALALYGYATAEGIAGRRHEFFPLAIGVSEKVSLWLPAVIAIGGKPLVPFIDPRRTKKLTSEGRRFAFSVMHERIRAADPDFAEVELGILQFGGNSEDRKTRTPRLFTARDVALFDFEAIDAMVRETYQLWREVLTEREAEARRRGTGTTGPLI